MLDAGAEVNARTSRGYTPLHEAVAVGDVDGVKLLLARGADADLADVEGVTPRKTAQQRGDAMRAVLPPR